jgi:hypothetical protein
MYSMILIVIIAASWLRAKTSSKHNHNVLRSIILTMVNRAEI